MKLFTFTTTSHSTGRQGFTLIETFVAITVFAVAIAGPLTLASSSLSSTNYAKDQITAYFLAQEGLEMIKNNRDFYFLNGLSFSTFRTSLVTSGCVDTDGCIIDATGILEPPLNLIRCSGVCPVLRKDPSGLYGYTLSWSDSVFTRKINIRVISNDEVVVVSHVSWVGPFQNNSVTLTNELFDWN